MVVAGHACLDLIPELPRGLELRPGSLTEVGPVRFAPGGAVPNVGIALTTLGVAARLVARVGDDALGGVLLGLLRSRVPHDALAFERVPGDSTSYTVIISPPDVDRLFLHHAGCNDRFDPARIQDAAFADARVLYFGYPPAMRGVFADGGAALAGLLHRARTRGVTTALDMSLPDPRSVAGRHDWGAFLARVLPQVDVFLPSWEEVVLMADRRLFSPDAVPEPALLEELSGRLLDLGAAIVGIKLGSRGMYLRTAGAERMAALGRGAPSDPETWADRQLWSPVFSVEVAGTTGSGDSTVAGFLAALLRDLAPADALRMAVAVGGHCVEAPDATSGLRSWEETDARVGAGWEQEPHPSPGPGWTAHQSMGILVGPRDRHQSKAPN